MSLNIKPKVSTVVKYQVPETIRNQNEKLIAFLEEYYRYMESQDNPLDIIRNLQNEFDVDNTRYFLDILKSHVFPYSMENADSILEDEYLIKFIRELYLSKGTADSFKYIFDKLYNVDAEIDYGRNYVFRTSDNEFKNSSSIVLKSPGVYLFDKLDGKRLTQRNNSATIQSVSLYKCGLCKETVTGTIDPDTNIIKNISDISKFQVGDVVTGFDTSIPRNTQVVEIGSTTVTLNKTVSNGYSNEISLFDAYYKCILDTTDIVGSFDYKLDASFVHNGDTYTVNIISLINDIDINESGSLYVAGQKLKVIGGSGGQLQVSVKDVSQGSVDGLIINKAGTGYNIGDEIEFYDPSGLGNGASAYISEIDGYGAEFSVSYKIDQIHIKTPGRGYEVGDILGTSLLDVNESTHYLSVTSVDNSSTFIDIENPGYNYYYARAIFKQGGSYVYTSPIVNNKSIVQVPTPSGLLDVYANNGKVNGSGCSGTVVIDISGNYSFTVTTPGVNYVSPVVVIKNGSSETLETIFVQPTYNTEYGITAIAAHVKSSLPAASYTFDVVEQYGYGYSGTVKPLGAITAVSLVSPLIPVNSFNHVESHVITSGDSTNGTGASFYVYGKIHEFINTDEGTNYLVPDLQYTSGIGTGFVGKVNVDESGVIESVTIFNSGVNYPHNTTVTVSEGTLADIVPTINDLGELVELTVLNGGTGYSASSTITLTTGQNYPSIILTQTDGSISAVSVSSVGTKLFEPIEYVISDSYTPQSNITCSVVEDSNVITTTGNQFVNIVPGEKIYNIDPFSGINGYTVVSVTDANNIVMSAPSPITLPSSQFYFIKPYGRISKVTLTNGGNGYNTLPYVKLPTREANFDETRYNDLEDAVVYATSNSIGKILSCSIDNHGINYDEVPLLSAPATGIIDSLTRTVIKNEILYDKNWAYTDTVNYTDGPRAIVKYTNLAKGTIIMDEVSDDFLFYTEDGFELIAETGEQFAHEESFPINQTTTLVGSASGAELSFHVLNRASVLANNGAVVEEKQTFNSSNGFLSDPYIKLHDGNRIQDYSYFITTFDKLLNNIKHALSIVEYKNNISEMVHPAGYKMFGELKLDSVVDVPFKLWVLYDKDGNEIGPTTVLTLLLESIELYKDQLLNVSYSDGSRLKHDLEIILHDTVVNILGVNNVSENLVDQLMTILLVNEVNLIPLITFKEQYTEVDINLYGKPGYEFTPANLEYWKFDDQTSQPDLISVWETEAPYSGVYDDSQYLQKISIDFFKDATIQEIADNQWYMSKHYDFVLPSYIVTAINQLN